MCVHFSEINTFTLIVKRHIIGKQGNMLSINHNFRYEIKALLIYVVILLYCTRKHMLSEASNYNYFQLQLSTHSNIQTAIWTIHRELEVDRCHCTQTSGQVIRKEFILEM